MVYVFFFLKKKNDNDEEQESRNWSVLLGFYISPVLLAVHSVAKIGSLFN
jgi:hypothetical protein